MALAVCKYRISVNLTLWPTRFGTQHKAPLAGQYFIFSQISNWNRHTHVNFETPFGRTSRVSFGSNSLLYIIYHVFESSGSVRQLPSLPCPRHRALIGGHAAPPADKTPSPALNYPRTCSQSVEFCHEDHHRVYLLWMWSRMACTSWPADLDGVPFGWRGGGVATLLLQDCYQQSSWLEGASDLPAVPKLSKYQEGERTKDDVLVFRTMHHRRAWNERSRVRGVKVPIVVYLNQKFLLSVAVRNINRHFMAGSRCLWMVNGTSRRFFWIVALLWLERMSKGDLFPLR